MNNNILNITKALAYTENGGKPDTNNLKSGKTGETKSMFQFEPATWKAYSQQVLGKVVPITPENESLVAYGKVNKWYKQLEAEGHSVEEIPKMIASMWNAGPGEPNAYTGKFSNGSSSKGTNAKYGVKYDVPSYVSKFDKYLNSFGKGQSPSIGQAETDTSESTPPTMPNQQPVVATQPSPTNIPDLTPNMGTTSGLLARANPSPVTKTASPSLPTSNGLINPSKKVDNTQNKKHKGYKK